METPYLAMEGSPNSFTLEGVVTTLGRGTGVDIALNDPAVSRLHCELVRRGPHVYVCDLGLSSNGTLVNGRPVARRLLSDGDVLQVGRTRLRAGGVPDVADDAVSLRRSAVPDLTRREREVLAALCRPALQQEAFVAPATAQEVADELVVTEAAVKQHLLRLYQKFRVAEGPNRRARLANEVISAGVVQPGHIPQPRPHDQPVRAAG
jgi:DNA-binding CsgD family transcriptional regulator